MADARSLFEKLQAMASQDVSPHEAEVARRVLERMQVSAGETETRQVLTREMILDSPDRKSADGLSVQVRINGQWVRLDRDEYVVVFPRSALFDAYAEGGTDIT